MAVHSEDYKELLKENHRQAATKPWGRSGGRNFGARLSEFLTQRPGIKTVLDFGAGQTSLERRVRETIPERYAGLIWTNYDPGIDEIDVPPTGSFDLIVSSDVLEHIEPESLPEVLKWLYEHTRHYQYHLIACDPCKSRLPDGRNAHLIVEEPEWWFRRFRDHGTLMYTADEKVMKRGEARSYACLQIDKSG
jgi:hypothetical protein